MFGIEMGVRFPPKCVFGFSRNGRSLSPKYTLVPGIRVGADISGTPQAMFPTLERCWRDIHTAVQHMQVQDGRWETAGRVLMGLDPGSPLP